MRRGLSSIAVLAVACAVLVPAPTHALTTSCAFDAGSRVVTAILDTGTHSLRVGVDHEIMLDEVLPCGAAVDDPRNTPLADTITVQAPSGVALVVDLGGGAFAPGFSLEPGTPAEVEIDVHGPLTSLRVEGSGGPDDLRAGRGAGLGVNLNGDDDLDVSLELDAPITLRGQNGADTLRSAADGLSTGVDVPATLDGGDGADTLLGGGEADLIRPGGGNDDIDCGAALSVVDPTQSPLDVLTYDDAPSPVTVDLAAGLATGGNGADTIAGSCTHLTGSAYDDDLLGGSEADVLEGGPGGDLIDGRGGKDFVWYAAAAAGVHVDLESGGATGQGADALDRVEGIVGSSYDDRVAPFAATTFLGLGGSDTIDLSGASSPVSVSLSTAAAQPTPLGAVTLADVECIIGGSAADVLTGSGVANRLDGAGGDDRLLGLGADDTLVGGPGRDAADYSAAPSRVHVFLGLGAGGGAGDDVLSSIEDVIGSAFADRIVGSAGVNRLFGRGGDDVMRGLRGNDALKGEAGNDSLDGGAGRDACSGGTGSNVLKGCE